MQEPKLVWNKVCPAGVLRKGARQMRCCSWSLKFRRASVQRCRATPYLAYLRMLGVTEQTPRMVTDLEVGSEQHSWHEVSIDIPVEFPSAVLYEAGRVVQKIMAQVYEYWRGLDAQGPKSLSKCSDTLSCTRVFLVFCTRVFSGWLLRSGTTRSGCGLVYLSFQNLLIHTYASLMPFASPYFSSH